MGKTYCFSDLHGELGLFKQIQEFLQKDDTCYILGDVIDRGEHGITILKEVMKDKRFKMLLGNHEQMLIEQLKDLADGYTDFYGYFQNGGLPTWEEFIMSSEEEQGEIYQFITHLPIKVQYKDKILCHAGYHPGVSVETKEVLLWDRSHLDYTSPIAGEEYIIHGHTPSCFIQEGYFGVLQYHEKKICLDCGTPYSKKIGILDLDSLEIIYFKEDK